MTWELDIENVAGIYDGQATLEPGLNAVEASNWQGKSSFIEAIKTGLGTAATLTEGKDRGRVALQTPERDVTVDLVGSNGTVRVEGTPYLEDEYDVVRASLFACLGERNEVRRTVREGENLEEVLLRPLDFENIDARIADLKREREQVDAELAQATEANKRLPSIQERVTRLEGEVEDLRDQREELSGTTADERGDDGNGDGDDAESLRSELSQAQADRSRVETQIERLTGAIDRLETRLEDRRSELADVEIDDDAAFEDDLEAARKRQQTVNRRLEVLQSVYSTTELVLADDNLDLITDVDRELTGDSIVCFTCGTAVDREALETRLDALGDEITDLRAELETHRDRVERLEARREERTQNRRRKRDLEDEIDDLEESLADREQRLEEARERFDRLDERVADLDEAVDETVARLTDVESEIKYREAELEDARDELATLESRADRIDRLAERREELQGEIEELRNRKETIKRRAREEFGAAIEEISDRFETGFESAHLTSDFELVVARDGREASLEALSEGELELIGFIAALAGYESFDVADAVPLMLVDGVGSLADENLHTLVEYLEERTTYLVFTTYPEHTAFDGQRIDPTSWSVASRERAEAN